MRCGWTIEAELFNEGQRQQPANRFPARLAAAFTGPDLMPNLCLPQRYESRLHRMYQRALNNLLELHSFKSEVQITEEPEEPIPISEHTADPQTRADTGTYK